VCIASSATLFVCDSEFAALESPWCKWCSPLRQNLDARQAICPRASETFATVAIAIEKLDLRSRGPAFLADTVAPLARAARAQTAHLQHKKIAYTGYTNG
jgi:hypothetical protein